MKPLSLFTRRTPLTLASALAIAAVAYPAAAQTGGASSGGATVATTPAPATAPAAQPDKKQNQTAMMKLSQDGFTAMRAIRAARLAIFDGDPKIAQNMVAQAQKSLQAASKDASALPPSAANGSGTNGSAGNGSSNVKYVPIDGQIVLADSFVDTSAKKAHIDKANQHIANGQSKQAMDELKLAEVDASFTSLLMPLQTTTKHVDAAKKLMDQQKFYEANLALKAAEDGLIVDTVALGGVPAPKSGSGGTANAPANANTPQPASAPSGTAPSQKGAS